MRLIVFFAFVTVAFAQLSTHDPYYCYAEDPIQPQRSMFSTITQYDNARGSGLNFGATRISSCRPNRFWMFTRGGSRLPSEGNLIRMRELEASLRTRVNRGIDRGRANFCRADRENILSWTLNENFTAENFYTLTNTGFEEVRSMAMRFQTFFPEVLPPVYEQSQFQFRHTYRERTEDSARAFATGLFGNANVVFENIPAQDRLLRPIDSCQLYDEWASRGEERAAFWEGVDYQNAIAQASQKLGLVGSDQLSRYEFGNIMNYCQFEQSYTPNIPAPWCAAFSIANQEVAEYADDLEKFLSTGYGGDVPLFSNLNCAAMQNLLQFFNADASEPNLARIFVTHSQMIRLFAVTLGVFRDEVPLTRHNFAQQIRRQWNGSRVSPKAANFAFIHHSCDGEDDDIVIYHNEHPLWIPGCEAPGLCKQQTFFNLFQRFLNANCDELFCSRN